MKRDESPSPNSKIFHVRPGLPLSYQKPERISYIAEALNEEFNSIARFRTSKVTSDTHYVFWQNFYFRDRLSLEEIIEKR